MRGARRRCTRRARWSAPPLQPSCWTAGRTPTAPPCAGTRPCTTQRAAAVRPSSCCCWSGAQTCTRARRRVMRRMWRWRASMTRRRACWRGRKRRAIVTARLSGCRCSRRRTGRTTLPRRSCAWATCVGCWRAVWCPRLAPCIPAWMRRTRRPPLSPHTCCARLCPCIRRAVRCCTCRKRRPTRSTRAGEHPACRRMRKACPRARLWCGRCRRCARMPARPAAPAAPSPCHHVWTTTTPCLNRERWQPPWPATGTPPCPPRPPRRPHPTHPSSCCAGPCTWRDCGL
mmetsp:Transcript_13864/g.35387  ORF Transcript_13864/g.35387 Transcript_13864/m.35387 type:complete len:286 (-) Transcript_13864:1223-2080(-)